MTSGNGAAGTSSVFTHRDMETIFSIIENQPLQNMKVAREVQALQMRFAAFCSQHLSKPNAPTPATAVKKGTKQSAGDVDPAS